jgi:hypothetical protein
MDPDDSSWCPGGNGFTIAVLPDTQKLTSTAQLSAVFDCQTEWIKANKVDLGIEMVFHVGDVVQTGGTNSWLRAKRSMCVLEQGFGANRLVNVPYIISVGGLDNGIEDFFPLTCDTCPPGIQIGEPALESCPEGTLCAKDNDINYAFRPFTVDGIKWLALAIGWDADLDDTGLKTWLEDVAASYADRRILVVVHRFINDKGELKDDAPLDLWRRFISRQENIVMIFNGHHGADGDTRQVEFKRCSNTSSDCDEEDSFDGQRNLVALFSNFQNQNNPSDPLLGTLQVVNICPGTGLKMGKVRVRHISPWLNTCFDTTNAYFNSDDDDWSGFGQAEDFSLVCGDGLRGVDEACDAGGCCNQTNCTCRSISPCSGCGGTCGVGPDDVCACLFQ